ncbi:MAG: HAMP domain-containing histidine kinase [Clostridia bacterium]|nr:HAMP domain-containing histidine kinase [Clostridia bacterium]
MKKNKIKDDRIKARRVTFAGFIIAYIAFAVMSAGQILVLGAFIPLKNLPPEYIAGMVGYWAIVALIYLLITRDMIRKRYEMPMRKLSEAAGKVAQGDFSVYIPPVHAPNKADYVDVMFQDFNSMVEELASIETLKDDFIASVSHEIKTPLAVIRNYAKALQLSDIDEDKRREYADVLVKAADNLTALVTNILRLNKLDNQGISVSSESFDFCAHLCECILNFETLWEGKDIQLTAEIEEGLAIVSDKSMLELVWNNLISNAVKFTPRGGKIRVRQTHGDGLVTVEISDSGIGMSQETIARIFDKFYQGDKSHSVEGNGLGLALVRKVTDLLGGTVEVVSRLNEGSTFIVKFPFK